ncbi:hypothetical protein L6R29_24480 [Myxococcota bacterium]|nr:hypothetical protein [Myxococcota bacterium]
MSLSSLSTGSMILVLKHLLQPESRKILEQIPLLQPFIPELERVLSALESSRPDKASSDEAERIIRKILNDCDRKHDTLNRHLYRLLEITTDALPESMKPQYQAVHERLFPLGLAVNRLRWVDEAGEVARFEKQLRSDANLSRMLLEMTLTVGGVERLNGLALAEALIQVGKDMDQKLLELNKLQSGGTTAETQARRDFVRWVTRFVDLAQIALAAQPILLQKLLVELQKQLDDVPSEPSKS